MSDIQAQFSVLKQTADPVVADVSVVTPTQVLVHGRAPGEVSLLIWDELGILPAVKRFREQHRATAFGTAPIPTMLAGPRRSAC